MSRWLRRSSQWLGGAARVAAVAEPSRARAQFRRRKEPKLEQWSFGTLYDYAILGGNDSLALFSDCDAALKFIKEQLEARAHAIGRRQCVARHASP